MFKRKRNWFLMVVVLVLGVGSAQGQVTYFDDDFELGLSNWASPGATPAISVATDFSGHTGQSMKIDQEAGGTGLYAYNIPGTIPVTAGDEFSFSFDYYATGGNGYFNILAKRDDDSNIGVLFAAGLNVTDVWYSFNLAGDYPASVPITVPAEATKLQFNFYPWAPNATLYIDDVLVVDPSETVPPDFLLGDANGDGVVSAGDYAAVQANFGNTSGGVAPAVPEPTTICIVGIGLVALVRRRRK